VSKERFESCPTCGAEHRPSALPVIGTRVVVTRGEFKGKAGRLIEWSRYGAPLYCRLQFDEPMPEYGGPWRENVDPCQMRRERFADRAIAIAPADHDGGDEASR